MQVHEHLLALVESHDATGKALYERLEGVLKSHKIDVAKCISDSFDSAANMSGKYSGLTSWLQRASPGHIHVWCYAHVLNLVMTDTTRELRSSNQPLWAT